MRTYRNLSIPVRYAVILVIGVALFASAVSAQDRGTCVTAWVPEAFALPDGSMRVAGKFTLCVDRALNPVADLHRLSTDAEGAILVVSRRSLAREYSADRAVLRFFRAAPGAPLDLVSYVIPFGGKAWKYTLKKSHEFNPFESASLGAPTPTGEVVTLLASNGN